MVSFGYVIMSLSSELETFQTNIDFWFCCHQLPIKIFQDIFSPLYCVQNILELSLGKEGGPIIELRCNPDHYKHSFL